MIDSDLSRLPSGGREWTTLIKALRDADDTDESESVELKSDVDPTSKRGAAKIAKFILGAANRLPSPRTAQFEGRALFVAGAGHGEMPGVRCVEDKDLENALRPFLGVDGPSWDTQRVATSVGREVLVVVVPPHSSAGRPYTCRADGEGVNDGAVYIRARGETRQAKSAELERLLAERDNATSRPPLSFDVELVGPVHRVVCGLDAFSDYVERTARGLRSAADPTPGLFPIGALSFMTSPEPRSREEYLAEIDQWESLADTWAGRMVDGLTASFGTPAQFRVVNQSRRFLKNLEVQAHLSGDVRGLEPEDERHFKVQEAITRPPRKWGPVPSAAFTAASLINVPDYSHMVRGFAPRGGPGSSFSNSGSVDATFSLPELRPEAEHFFDDFVLLMGESRDDDLHGTWRATVEGVDDVFEGTISCACNGVRDITDFIQNRLSPTEEAE